jgi:hypothetical protein
LNGLIIGKALSAPDRSIPLSDIDKVAEAAGCSPDEALAVLTLLSNRSTGLLRMDLRSESAGNPEVPSSEFTRMLTGWWETKSVSDEEWKRWASGVQVRWVLCQEVEKEV